MSSQPFLLPLLLLLLLTLSSSVSSHRVFLEHDVPSSVLTPDPSIWTDAGPLPHDAPVQLTFAVKHGIPTPHLEAALLDVSTPGSHAYGRYLSVERVADLVRPTPSHLAAVRGFIAQYDGTILEESKAQDYIHAQFVARAAADMLQVSPFRRYIRKSDGLMLVRSTSFYSVPARISQSIDFIGGVNRFPKTLTLLDAAGSRSPLDGHTTVSNAPVTVFALGGGHNGFVFFMPKCADGTVPTASTPCSIPIEWFSMYMQPVDSSLGPGYETTVHLSSCASCTAWNTSQYGSSLGPACAQTVQSLNIPQGNNALFCTGNYKGLPAPCNVSISITTTYSTTTSAPGVVYNMLEPVVTPESIRTMYSVPSGMVIKESGNTQAVAEFLQQYYAPSDLSAYLKLFNVTDIAPVTVTGPNNASNPGGEATLDIEVIMGVAPGAPTTFWSLAGLRNNSAPPSNSNQEPFLTWITAVNEDTSAPLVHSISYSDDEYVMPRAFTDRLNVEFMKSGLLGISLLFATGDDGVCSESVRTSPCTRFAPSFPPASPYVTAVGGTQFGRDANQAIIEVVANSQTGSFITSGGGFSNRYLQPQYQAAFVKQYLSTTAGLPPNTWFNASGRAYPDVSSISTNFLCIIGGFYTPIGGTSASTPTTAALITLLNDIRLSNGLPQLGFLNPLLYSLAENPKLSTFHDITIGINKCSAVPTQCCPYGFPAVVGWDASTGLGSLNFEGLSTAILPSVGRVSVVTQSATFAVSSADLLVPGGIFAPNVTAIVRILGTIPKVNIVAGAVQYKFFEQGVKQSIGSGNMPYFECNNKACDPSAPISLRLQDPGVVPTAFMLTLPVVLPPAQATGQFTLEVWGQDQNHTPEDFTAGISYNFTMF